MLTSIQKISTSPSAEEGRKQFRRKATDRISALLFVVIIALLPLTLLLVAHDRSQMTRSETFKLSK